MYRVISRAPLTTGHKCGDLVSITDFKPGIFQALLANSKIELVASPALSELPGWSKRAEKLATIGLITVDQFLEADEATIKQVFPYRSSLFIERWKNEIKYWIKPEPQTG